MSFRIGSVVGYTLGTVALASYFYLNAPSNNLEKHVENSSITAPDQSRGIDSKEVDIYNFLNKYQSEIRFHAARQGVPDTYVASVIAGENYGRKRSQDVKDIVGDWLNLDVSLGPGQMTISTAAWLDGITGELTPEQREMYEEILTDPETNIEYVARYLSHLKNRDNRFPDMAPEEFGSSLEAMAIVASEYMMGPTSTSIEDAQPNHYGLGVLSGMTDPYLQLLFDTPLLSEDDVKALAEQIVLTDN